MDDSRNLVMFCGQDYRDSYKSTFGEDHVRAVFLHQAAGLRIAFDDTEGIGKIFQIKITAEFAGRNAIIGNTGSFYKFSFYTIIRADVVNFIAAFLERRKKGQIGGNMSGSSTAGQDDFFHKKKPPFVLDFDSAEEPVYLL